MNTLLAVVLFAFLDAFLDPLTAKLKSENQQERLAAVQEADAKGKLRSILQDCSIGGNGKAEYPLDVKCWAIDLIVAKGNAGIYDLYKFYDNEPSGSVLRQRIVADMNNPKGWQECCERAKFSPTSILFEFRASQDFVLWAAKSYKHEYDDVSRGLQTVFGDKDTKTAIVSCLEKISADDAYALIADAPAARVDLIVSKMPLDEARKLLKEHKDLEQDTYWRIWNRCATSSDALEVWKGKFGKTAKLNALSKIDDEAVLQAVACGKRKEYALVALSRIRSADFLYKFQSVKDADYRICAARRLLDVNRVSNASDLDRDRCFKLLKSYYGTKEYLELMDMAFACFEKIGDTEATKQLAAVGQKMFADILTESKTAHSKGFMTFCGLYLGMQQWKAEFIIKAVKFKGKFNYANDILCDCEFAPTDLTEAYKDYPSTEFKAWTETLVESYELPESSYAYVNATSELGFGWDSVFKVTWGDSILYIQNEMGKIGYAKFISKARLKDWKEAQAISKKIMDMLLKGELKPND